MMLGYLLARAGIDVVVLEKHADFLRDFRGDTIHPSTLELIYELGLLPEFLQRPHQELRQVGAEVEGNSLTIADFSRLPTHCKFIAFMPQWDFLNFLAAKAQHYPEFHLRMQAEVTDLLEEDSRVTGVRAKTPQGLLEIRADLVVGADGRHSTVRTQAGLPVKNLGAPIDVLWMRLSRRSDDPQQTLGRFQTGRTLITLDRGDYWQCAYIIPKGGWDQIQRDGIEHFRREIINIAPFLTDRTDEIRDWNDVKLLSVAVDRLEQWARPGLLCIGDAAHAMSPVGGVGINLAIQDAVAAANLLAGPLAHGPVSLAQLNRLQRRRMFPVRMTQTMQVFIHHHFLERVIVDRSRVGPPPLVLRLISRFRQLRYLTARLVGMGFRPEHVHTRDVHS